MKPAIATWLVYTSETIALLLSSKFLMDKLSIFVAVPPLNAFKSSAITKEEARAPTKELEIPLSK